MKKIIAVIAIVAALLSGCAASSSDYKAEGTMPYPNVMKCGAGSGYYYVVDKNTSVVYLAYNGYNRYAITVMLNADGTPVTAEQIGVHMEG